MRKTININQDWKFTKGEVDVQKVSINNDIWEGIDIPHTWNQYDAQDGNADYYRGVGWYAKEILLEEHEKDQRVFIEFEGANSVAEVFVNGKFVSEHRGGYTTFRMDITDFAIWNNKNIVAVKVDNSHREDVFPLRGDHNYYGGIYRDANLIFVNENHIDLSDYGSKGVYVTQLEVNETRAIILVDLKLSVHKEALVNAAIYDEDGNIVAERQSTTSKSFIQISLEISNPNLWEGIESPYLYTCEVKIICDDKEADCVDVQFGLRTFYADSKKGFFLNGKHYPIKGVSKHQDILDKGWAIFKEDIQEDIRIIKEMGANAIRLAHYPHDRYLYELCDKEGIVIWSEIPFNSRMSDTDIKNSNAVEQLYEMIKQNYNHPSIIIWGIGNEASIGGNDQRLKDFIGHLNKIAKELDSSRLTAVANITLVSDDDQLNKITDVLGYNKYYGWYYDELETLPKWMDEFHKLNPEIKLGISEIGCDANMNLHSASPQKGDYSEEYQCVFHESSIKAINEREYLWGVFVWVMFDFASASREEAGVKGRNNKGLVTYDRKIKKDAYYWFKANWSDEKFVHIAGRRFVNRHEQNINVKVYSNCSKVQLCVNGEDKGTVQLDKAHVFENAKLKDGENAIEAYGFDGEKTYEDKIVLQKVQQEDKSYALPKRISKVENWTDSPDIQRMIEEAKNADIDISNAKYSTSSTIAQLQKSEKAKEVLGVFFGDMVNSSKAKLFKNLRLDKVLSLLPMNFSDDFMYALNYHLSKID